MFEALGMLALVALLATTLVVRRDYERFLALGPGGTPQTFGGYLRVKVLSLFALSEPYKAVVTVPPRLSCTPGYLTNFPWREHDRPSTEGIAPHRQITQRADEAIFKKLAAAIEALAPGPDRKLTVATSCFEKHGTGLFSTCPVNQTCQGEIVHVHPSDGSMHLTLHPADVNAVLKARWGERHPLAGVFNSSFLPEGFIMLYAPQNEQEIEIVLRVVKAACWFVCGAGSTQADGEGHINEVRGLDVQVEDPRKVLSKL